MIHYDILLRLIEEFMRALSRITELRQDQQPRQAARAIDDEIRALLGVDREAVVRLSTTELLARIIRTSTTLEVRHKSLFLVALLKESGDLADEEGDEARSREAYLKALDLLLDLLARPDGDDVPQYVPSIEALARVLREGPLPATTRAMLMHHYERSGQFDRAEDALFALLESEPPSRELAELGAHFFRRLLAFSDETLRRGHLPRSEVEAGLREFEARAAA